MSDDRFKRRKLTESLKECCNHELSLEHDLHFQAQNELQFDIDEDVKSGATSTCVLDDIDTTNEEHEIHDMDLNLDDINSNVEFDFECNAESTSHKNLSGDKKN
jgi:hypothetical protein